MNLFRLKPEEIEMQARLGKGRLEIFKKKVALKAAQSRGEVAKLLATGKQESARIKVEGVMRDEHLLEAYEHLTIFLETILQRARLIADPKRKDIPRDNTLDAISSIIYAARRLGDFPELAQLSKLFESKFGKEYAAEAASDAGSSKWQVHPNMVRCLLVEPPSPDAKLAALSDIAQQHGVEWDMSASAREMGVLRAPLAAALAAPVGQAAAGLRQPPAHGGNGGSGSGGFSAAQAQAAADWAAQFAAAQPMSAAPLPPPPPQQQQQQAPQAAAVAAPTAAPQHFPLHGEVVDGVWRPFTAPGEDEGGDLPQDDFQDMPQGETELEPAAAAATVAPAAGGEHPHQVEAAGPSAPGDASRAAELDEESLRQAQKAYDAALGPPNKPFKTPTAAAGAEAAPHSTLLGTPDKAHQASVPAVAAVSAVAPKGQDALLASADSPLDVPDSPPPAPAGGSGPASPAKAASMQGGAPPPPPKAAPAAPAAAAVPPPPPLPSSHSLDGRSAGLSPASPPPPSAFLPARRSLPAASGLERFPAVPFTPPTPVRSPPSAPAFTTNFGLPSPPKSPAGGTIISPGMPAAKPKSAGSLGLPSTPGPVARAAKAGSPGLGLPSPPKSPTSVFPGMSAAKPKSADSLGLPSTPGSATFGFPGVPGAKPGSPGLGLPATPVSATLGFPDVPGAKPGSPGLGLPAAPKSKAQPGAPSEPDDDYEELTRRFEALKRV